MLSPHFKKLETAYIFPIIESKLSELQKAHPCQHTFNLGVGDIALPLSKVVAKVICAATLERTQNSLGYGPCGGFPFLIFWKTPEGVKSWDFFDILLEKAKVITIPGSGFGPSGGSFVRLSCFLTNPTAKEAADALFHHVATT